MYSPERIQTELVLTGSQSAVPNQEVHNNTMHWLDSVKKFKLHKQDKTTFQNCDIETK